MRNTTKRAFCHGLWRLLPVVAALACFTSLHAQDTCDDDCSQPADTAHSYKVVSPLALTPGTMDADLRQVVCDGTLTEVTRYFAGQHWTDGLPIIPPTAERVDSFLSYTRLKANTIVAMSMTASRVVQVWHVAVNGVMAGCKPEFMPILVALTRAMAQPDFQATLGSSHGWTPYCWLNGPVARQLGFSHGQGQVNAHANMVLGRYMSLALQNLLGLYVGQDRRGTFGYPMPWCLAEDEEACRRAGWPPYHTQQGFKAGDNAVTVCSALLWGSNMAPATTDGEKIMQLLAWDISKRTPLATGSGEQFTYRTVLMTEPVAACLAGRYGSPAALEDCLVSTARRPLYERAYARYHGSPDGSSGGPDMTLGQLQQQLAEEEGAALTATPEWYDNEAGEMTTVATMRKGETAMLVTGDTSRNKLQTIPGGKMVTEAVVLPDNWDALMAAKGYQPLSAFLLP